MAVVLQFDEILLDPGYFNLGFATGGPTFANNNSRSPSTGITRVAILRYDPQIEWSADFQDISHPDPKGLAYFNNIWYGGFGSAYGFRVRVETDHSVQDEVIATGDGATKDFKLTKLYRRPGTTTHDYIRRICKPVVSTNLASSGSGGNPAFGSVSLFEPNGVDNRIIEVAFVPKVNGVAVGDGNYTIKNTTGDLHINTAPPAGQLVSWSGQFDTPFQFWGNALQQKADFPAEIRGIQMIEIVPASLGII